MNSLAILSLAAFLLLAPAAVEPLEVKRLELATGGQAGQPSIAVDSREGFVVTWQEREERGASLWFAVIDRNGGELRRGRVARGRDWFVNWADFPSLAVLENGDWVTHYLQKSASATYAYDVRLVRSTDRGRTWSAPVTPHTDGTPTEHGFVTLRPLGGDRVLVVWLDGRRTGGEHAHGESKGAAHGAMSVRSAVLDRAGTRSEERELDERACDCCQTDAVRLGGDILLAYRDRSPAETRDISLVRRSSSGAWSRPKALHADGWRIEGCPVNGPALAGDGDRFLAVWPTHGEAGPEVRYTVRGWSDVGRVERLDGGRGTLGRVDAARWSDGYLVSWIGSGSGDESGLELAELDVTGHVIGRRAITTLPPTRMSGNPRLAADGERALVAWTEAGEQAAGLGLALIYK